MLKSLDLILSLAVVMLVASMAVTVLTQIYTSLRNTRGKHLLAGIADLLKQIDPSITSEIATGIATAVLAHPLVHDSEKRLGALVHRDELTHLLMEIAAGDGADAISSEARAFLIRALKANGVNDPAASLRAIRGAALELEVAHPEMAAHVRRDLAIVQAAGSQLVAKINGCFDQIIDRVSARFTLSARKISLVAAVIVAATLKLDTVAIVKRLATGTDAPLHPEPATFAGIVLSALLLSLGAPFWFEALKDVLRLRSAMAGKDDVQRAQRSTADTPLAR